MGCHSEVRSATCPAVLALAASTTGEFATGPTIDLDRTMDVPGRPRRRRSRARSFVSAVRQIRRMGRVCVWGRVTGGWRVCLCLSVSVFVYVWVCVSLV